VESPPEVLLRRGQQSHVRHAVRLVTQLRLRVLGLLTAPRHNAPHRPLLSDADGRAAAESGRRAGRPRGHWQNRNGQGPGQVGGQTLPRLQLLRGPRLQDARQVLQRTGAVGLLVLLRRVQSHRRRGEKLCSLFFLH